MFSRIIKSARSLVYNNTENTDAKSQKLTFDEIMVKTRTPPNESRKETLVDENELNDENTINVCVPTPGSSRRKRKAAVEEEEVSEEGDDVTPSPKKRKVLPVRAKDEPLPITSSRPVVEIPVKAMAPEADLPSVVEAPKSSTKTKHRRFESEEPAEEFFSTALEQSSGSAEAEDEDSEDSDDEAPEAVGKEEAVQTIKSKEIDAAKAVKEQISATRQKRKEKEETLRKQAEQAKKRKAKSKKNKATEPEIVEGLLESQQAGIHSEDEILRNKAIKISSTGALPDLLPLEYLEDESESEVESPEEQPRKVLNKKKFKDLSGKGPKDRHIGNTTYRVTKIQSTDLAPKATHNARQLKEAWIQGRSGQKIEPHRKASSKGFFKK